MLATFRRVWRDLPGWVSRQALFRENPAPVYRPIKTYAPGWHQLAMEFTTGEGEGFRDPAVTRAIHQFWPGAIPLWCRWVFWNPNEGIGPTVYGRHAVGSHISNPREDKSEYQRIIVTPGYKGPRPNQIDLIWMDPSGPPDPDLPGAYRPWDWRLVNELEERYGYTARLKVKDIQDQYVKGVIEKRQIASMMRQIMHDEIMKDLGMFVDRKMEEAGEVAMKEYFSGGKHEKKRPRRIYLT